MTRRARIAREWAAAIIGLPLAVGAAVSILALAVVVAELLKGPGQ